MAYRKLSISIPETMQTFLAENKTLKPSQIFQARVEEIQNSIKNNPQLIEALKTIENQKRAREITQRELLRAIDFIEKKGFFGEFNGK